MDYFFKGLGGGGGSDLGKGRRLPVPNIPGGELENWSTWEQKTTLVRCRENPTDINLHEGFTSRGYS